MNFSKLTMDVRAAGLFDRRLGYYSAQGRAHNHRVRRGMGRLLPLGRFVGNPRRCGAISVLVATQLGFLGHDAGHRQIFESRRANRLLGLGIGNGLIGLSFGWWVPKHNAHHAHPNQVDRDPDIGVGLPVASTGDQTAGRQGMAEWLARRQAELFFPLMLLRSTGLYVSGIKDLIRRRDRTVIVESALFVVHVAFYATAVFWVLSPLKAIAFCRSASGRLLPLHRM